LDDRTVRALFDIATSNVASCENEKDPRLKSRESLVQYVQVDF